MVLEGKERRKSPIGFKNNFEVAEWNNFPERTNQFIFQLKGSSSQEWHYHRQFFFRNGVDWVFFLVQFVEKFEDAFINKSAGVTISRKDVLKSFNLIMERLERRTNHIGTI